MAFEGLSEKLQNVFRKLKSRGRLTEEDVDAAMREVKMALLEADVNYRVVKDFVSAVRERAVGQDVITGLNPGQTVVKIVNEEMIKLLGSETGELRFKPQGEVTVVMMAGLQGAGKTTTSAKLAGLLKSKGRKPLLAALDVHRPAAVEQLKIVGEKQGVEVFSMGTGRDAADIAFEAVKFAEGHGNDTLILDTAGRLHVDDEMMDELCRIKAAASPYQTVLTVDAMTGQDAVNVAKTFDERIGIDGVIVTKLDGDARGGAVLSVKAVTGKPVLYVGMGEKLSDLEQFHPDRMASRILGMGDVLSLIEKAGESIDEKKALAMSAKLKKAKFDYEDYLESMRQMRKMGGLSKVMSMMPGMTGPALKGFDVDGGEKRLAMTEAIIYSMTVKERQNPELLNPSRKNRIAKGAGVSLADVNSFVKQFDQMRKLMKRPGTFTGGRRMRGRGGFPF